MPEHSLPQRLTAIMPNSFGPSDVPRRDCDGPVTEPERCAAAVLQALFPHYPEKAMVDVVRAIRADYVPGRMPFEDQVMGAYHAAELDVAARRAVQDYRTHQAARLAQADRAAKEDAVVTAAAWLQTQTDWGLAECMRLAVGVLTRYQKARSEAGAAAQPAMEGR